MIRSEKFDELNVEIHPDRAAMGAAAAARAAEIIDSVLRQRRSMNIIFAAAPSQIDFLDALVALPGIPWQRIRAFHMDEYIGLTREAPQGFGNFLQRHLYRRVPLQSVDCLDSQATDPDAECERYSRLLGELPPDLTCLGIGENGHLAFNDPHEANFDDPLKVRVVNLDPACRAQQVNDGCFAALSEVPEKAMTLTIPALIEAEHLVCIVPAAQKAQAVKDALLGPMSVACPASILRRQSGACLFLDGDSSRFIR